MSAQEDQTESPYFTVFCSDTSVVDFPLIATNISATISGVIANVEMEQVYENTGDSVLDATYVFPMSTNAAIYAMEMLINERLVYAEIKRKEEAQAIFDSAKANGQTASLLEQNRPNVFTMKIGNVRPGNTLKVRMKYTELMEPEKGVYQFVLPSAVGPRFSTDGESWVQQSQKDMNAVLNSALNIDLSIDAGMPIVADCTSHEAQFSYDGIRADCHLQTHPGKDFIVDYIASGNEIQTGLLLYQGEEENFFLSIIQPPRPEIDFVSPKREYVFIMDVSGSMTGTPIEVSKRLILNLLKDLNSSDKFNILFFAGGSNLLSPQSLPVTQDNINKAGKMIDDLDAGGGTQLLPALEKALALEGTANFSRTFVIITDGFVTIEKQAYQLIRERLGDANFFAFGIGNKVNREIIEGIAYVGYGESFVATNFSEANTIADTFKEYIERPALTNIKANFSGINAYDIEPISIPDVFAERPIIIYGKYDDAGSGSITLTGDYAEGQAVKTLNFNDYVANSDKNIALKYLWARRKIKLMADYGLGSNENDDISIEEEITLLGLKYSLITQFTSFVAVDSTIVSDNSEAEENNEELTDIDELPYYSKKQDRQILQIIGSNMVSSDILTLQLKNLDTLEFKDFEITIIDQSGRKCIVKILNYSDLKNWIRLNIEDLPNGLFVIRLSSGNKTLDTQKFIVSR